MDRVAELDAPIDEGRPVSSGFHERASCMLCMCGVCRAMTAACNLRPVKSSLEHGLRLHVRIRFGHEFRDQFRRKFGHKLRNELGPRY